MSERASSRQVERAAEIINSARTQAQSIVEQAEEHAKQQIRDAKQPLSIGSMADTGALEDYEALLSEAYTEIDQDIYKLALRTVDQGLNALFDDEDALFDFIFHVLETSIGHAKEVVLRVHPDIEEQLRMSKQRLQNALRGAGEVEIRGDRHLDRAGIVIETESGVIDAQPTTQLQSIAQVLGVDAWRG